MTDTVRNIGSVYMDLRDPGIYWTLVNSVKTPASENQAHLAGWPVTFWAMQRRIRLVIARHSGAQYPPLL